MKVARVVGSVVSTAKDPRLMGMKFLTVQFEATQGGPETTAIAVDTIGAGIEDLVVVVEGSSARIACHAPEAPVDLAVVAIIDSGG
jgi:ethanolamine utilization protein EutN